MLTPEGYSFIKSWEGFRANMYRCAAGVLTIGYGHVVKPGEEAGFKAKPLTEPQALALLIKDLERYEAAVDKYVKVNLQPRQRDVLVSFCYNVGIRGLMTSTLLKKLNAKDFSGASNELLRWVKGGHPPKTIDGLLRRREAERRIFIQGILKMYMKSGLKAPLDICLLPVSWEHPDYVRRARCA